MLSVFFSAYHSYGMQISSHTPVNSTKYESYEMEPDYDSLQRLANPFKTDDKEAIELIKQLKIDPDKIFVMSVKSIIEGIFSTKPDHIAYYLELIKSQKKALTAFEELWKTFVFELNSENSVDSQKILDNYTKYVWDQMTSELYYSKPREVIVLFMAALEYRQSITPGFYVSFVQGDNLKEQIFSNHLAFSFETKDGRHFEDMSKEGYHFTLPGLLSEDFQINGVDKLFGLAIKNDPCQFCLHEMGHAIWQLLGFGFQEIPLILVAQNLLMKNLFFPFLYLAQNNMPLLIRKTIENCQSSEYTNEREFFEDKIKCVESFYKTGKLPRGVEQKEKEELENIKAMFDGQFNSSGKLLDKSLKNSLLKQFTEFAIKFLSIYDSWTTSEELRQTMGIIGKDDYIYITNFSDFDLSVYHTDLIRWLHMCVRPCDIVEGSSINLCPEGKFVKLLFALHGVKFEEYVHEVREKEKRLKLDSMQNI